MGNHEHVCVCDGGQGGRQESQQVSRFSTNGSITLGARMEEPLFRSVLSLKWFPLEAGRVPRLWHKPFFFLFFLNKASETILYELMLKLGLSWSHSIQFQFHCFHVRQILPRFPTDFSASSFRPNFVNCHSGTNGLSCWDLKGLVGTLHLWLKGLKAALHFLKKKKPQLFTFSVKMYTLLKGQFLLFKKIKFHNYSAQPLLQIWLLWGFCLFVLAWQIRLLSHY